MRAQALVFALTNAFQAQKLHYPFLQSSTLLAMSSHPVPTTNPSPTETRHSEKIAWNVRPATTADTESASALLKKSYEALLPADYSEETLNSTLSKITEARPQLLTCGTWYLVEHPETGDIVGCGGWTQRSPQNDTTFAPHLRHFATDPDWTRLGVASSVWKRVQPELDAISNVSEVYSTLTAEKFYGSLGYESIKSMEIPLGPNGTCAFPCILMRRTREVS